MESPQQAKAGTRKNAPGAPKGKMKRCPYCGAKNKASFEYCIRCSEPLDSEAPEGVIAQERATLSKLLVVGIAAVVLLAAAALFFRGRSSEPTGSGAPAVQASTGAPSDLAPRETPIATGIDSKAVLGTFNAGLAAYNRQDYSTAATLFQEVIQEIPDNPSAHQYLGLCFYHQQDFAGALSALAEARRLRPDSFELLDHYVTAAKKAGDLESASVALNEYVQAHPDSRGARLELSRIARDLGRPEEALAQAAALASSDEASSEFQYEYGVSLKAAGKLDEAIVALKSSVDLDPSSAAAHHALGVTSLQAGKATDAVGPLEQAVARAPENGDFRFSLAQAYEKLDRIPESLAAYEAYLQRAAPSDPRAKVVRERLAVAKKTLAERNQAERAKGET